MSRGEPIVRSMADQVTERIREAILTGQIQPGARLRLAELEETYGMSQIPLREALRRLEAESLVESEAHRGARAARISVRELDDLYDLRRIIEVTIARRAVAAHSAESMSVVEADMALLDLIYSGADQSDYEIAHRRFHWDLLAPGASDEIERVLQGIWRRTGRYVRVAMRAFGTGDVGQGQHRHLLELLKAGDGVGVAEELERHLNLTQASIHSWYAAEVVKHDVTRKGKSRS